MLTKTQLKQLRNEIVLNSLFLKDYENSFYIYGKTCCDFFDSYVNYLYELATENNDNKLDIMNIIDKYDNIENLYNYYLMFACDPLPRDGYIAFINDTVFSGVFIYDFDIHIEDWVIAASFYHSQKDGLKVDKITKNKLYYDCKKEAYYFNKNKRKYYLNDFIKRGF